MKTAVTVQLESIDKKTRAAGAIEMAVTSDFSAVRIECKAGIRRAAEALRRIGQEIGDLRCAPVHDFADGSTMVDAEGNLLATDVFGWTGDDNHRWWDHISQIVLDSPITTACRYESDPFWCNEHGLFARYENPFFKSIDIVNLLERTGRLRPAIIAPVHLPFGRIGAISFEWPNPHKSDLSKEYETYGDFLGVCSRIFVTDYVRLMCRNPGTVTDPRLSEHEVCCLRWAALGKTDEEIGLILSRSRATVRFHLHNATLKLASVNRSQSVFKAAQLGYIGSTSTEVKLS
jgi:DNA-binding CsgD family transcriptional regulator